MFSEQKNMKTGIVILAGGKGTRYGKKKQNELFHGKTLLKRVYDKAKSVCENVVVVGENVPAGDTRSFSVINGLKALPTDTEMVVLLEAARPLVTCEQIRNILFDNYPSKSYVQPLVNTIIGRNGTFFDRDKMYELLVPQSFDYQLLIDAYSSGKFTDMTDETRVMYEYYQIKPKLIETEQNLFKVTYPNDLAVLESLYQRLKKNLDD